MKSMERIPLSAPVNREARIGISHQEHEEMSNRPRMYQFQSQRRRVLDCPRTMSMPPDWAHLKGKRIGAVTVIGYMSLIEIAKVGWRTGGRWLVQCDCGVYEPRHQKNLRQDMVKKKREYVDACTACRGVWAEMVKNEFKKTGTIPPGGLPTNRAFRVSSSPAHQPQKPRIRIKMGRSDLPNG